MLDDIILMEIWGELAYDVMIDQCSTSSGQVLFPAELLSAQLTFAVVSFISCILSVIPFFFTKFHYLSIHFPFPVIHIVLNYYDCRTIVGNFI